MAIEERMAKIEGGFEQTTLRINDLRQEMNQRIHDLKWEVRIWFGVLLAVMIIFKFI